MMSSHFTHILNILKKWLLRLARRSASLFFAVLSSLHRFAAGHLKFGDRRLITRFRSGVLPGSQEDIVGEGSPICPSLLPPGQIRREAAGEPPSPSDDPYTGSHSRPLRKGTAIPPLDANPTTMGYTSATETDGRHQGSVSSLHLSLQMGESSVNSRTDGPLQDSSSPGPLRLSGLHEVSATHSRPQGYMDDARSVNTTCTPSMRHLAPGRPYSQHASISRLSVGTGHSSVRSIVGSESRKTAYRTHEGPVHSRPVSVHGSMIDVHYGSPDTLSIPLDLPHQAVPVLDLGINHRVHHIAPPDINEQPGPEVVTYDGPIIASMTANEVRRYNRVVARDPDVTNITVPAMTITFPAYDMPVPRGWTTFVHPEGARYFVNQETRTFTEMNICDEDIYDDIQYYMEYLLDELQRTVEDRNLMRQVDLVIEPKVYEDNSVVCCYYFANHRDRCLFWFDDFNPKHIISDCKGVNNLSHIQLAIQAQYWRHWDYFPAMCPVTQNVVDDLKDMLIHATCDHLTSLQSSAAFDAIELKDHLSVVDKIKIRSTPPADQSMRRGHAAIVIGRIMYTFTQNHFTVHNWAYKPSSLMVVLAPLLFFDPVVQVRELHKIFVDELQDSNLLATVLLNANVGFLAINTVDKGGRNAIQMASYMSLVTSLGSIVLGLFLVSHDRTSGKNTATEAAVFLGRLHSRKHGLEKLAIIYSLPKALLMWGMAFFFAAFSIDWWTSGDITSRTVVGTVTLAVFVMISNSIIRTREGAKWSWPTWLHGDIRSKLSSHLADAWKQVMDLGQIGHIGNPQSYNDAIGLRTSVGLSAEADAPMHNISHITTLPSSEIPGPDDHDNHPNSSIPPIRSYHPTASVAHQPHDGNSVLPSLDSRIIPGVLSGTHSLQQIREDTQTVFLDQYTPETRCEPDSAPLSVRLNTSLISASEGMVGTPATIMSEHELQTAAVATDTGAPILLDSFGTEEKEGVTYAKNVVEEPGELEHPQHSPSTTPIPRIYARSATGDHFHHAPGAPKSTLQDGQDIIEDCQE
ncbi:hypothetical protein EDB19DRAFT_2042391 [Suillus lakei]|nr:hypothetical protein EDB19DRAFT_2042391 [Suillus lakei]